MPSEKTLKRIVILLGVILVGGFLTLVSIIIYRAVNMASDEEVAQVENSNAGTGSVFEAPVLTIPGGAQPLGMSRGSAVTVLKVRNADGEIEELVFDSVTGDYLGKLVRED